MFRGRLRAHTIESKGRICLPPEIVRELGETPIFVAFFEKGKGYLGIYPEGASELPSTQIWRGRIGKGNRILIPKELRNSFRGREILVLGAGDHLEIRRPTKGFPPQMTEAEMKELSRLGIWQ